MAITNVPRQHVRFPQTIEITEKDQRPDGGFGEGDNEPDPMEMVVCTECGLGDDDEHLLLCDRAISKP